MATSGQIVLTAGGQKLLAIDTSRSECGASRRARPTTRGIRQADHRAEHDQWPTRFGLCKKLVQELPLPGGDFRSIAQKSVMAAPGNGSASILCDPVMGRARPFSIGGPLPKQDARADGEVSNRASDLPSSNLATGRPHPTHSRRPHSHDG